jgi:hypothetical protein
VYTGTPVDCERPVRLSYPGHAWPGHSGECASVYGYTGSIRANNQFELKRQGVDRPCVKEAMSFARMRAMQGGGVAGCHVHLKMMDHAGDDGADGVRALRLACTRRTRRAGSCR